MYLLWGKILGKGNKAITSNFIIRRTSDSQGRLFPRKFIQLLKEAFDHAKSFPPADNRVLPHQSLSEGVGKANKQRTEDLRTEYVERTPYLDAIKGLKSTFDFETITGHLKKAPKGEKQTFGDVIRN